MIQYFSRCCFAFSFLLVLSFQGVYASPIPAPPKLAAKSYFLIDYGSGRVLAEKKADMPVEPASITKLMTAFVVYRELEANHLSLDEPVLISEKAWRMGGSRMYIEVGKQITVRQLLKGLIIQSGNDASVALAEHIAGSEEAFVEQMNHYALELGMTNTHYVNSTGWPHEEHLTTARDIATLSSAIIGEYPEQYRWYSEKVYSYNNIKQYNRNKLLWRDKSVDGLKTGHTESAGYCLVASAMRGDMRLISVVLGAKNEKARATESQSLLNYGFRFYESHELYAAGEQVNISRVWRGSVEQVELGLEDPLFVTIPRGQYKKLDAVMDVDAHIVAPIETGQQLGVVRVMLMDEEVIRKPLVALSAVEKGNFFQVVRDYVLQLFN